VAHYNRKDHLHQRAKREGFRSRAAYKLAEIQKSHRLLKRGQHVVDIGCWPGGWLQVAARAVGPGGLVVGVDIAVVDPTLKLENVIALSGDISETPVAEAILEALGGPAQVFLFDAAPKLTGVRAVDRAREEALLESVVARIPLLLRPGGDLLLKILEGPEAQAIDRSLRSEFDQAKALRPDATRKGSTERYLLARGYRGLGVG